MVQYRKSDGTLGEFNPDKLCSIKAEEHTFTVTLRHYGWDEYDREDEEIRNNCIYWLEKARKYFEKDEDLIYDKKWIVKCTDFIKSIKDRVQPQNTWKPSDEQIEALEHFVRSIAESGFASPYDSNTKLVYSLFNDLKKLREE